MFRLRQLGFLLTILLLTAWVCDVILKWGLPDIAYPPYRTLSSSQLHHTIPSLRRMYLGCFGGRRVFVETNEDGLRTHHSRREFLSKAHRVVCLGDSFVFGWCVQQEKAFPNVLEKLLRDDEGSSDVAVLNAGRVSYSSLLEEFLCESVLTNYRPDTVLLFLDPSDVGDDLYYAKSLTKADDLTLSRFSCADDAPQDYHGALWSAFRVASTSLLNWVQHPSLALSHTKQSFQSQASAHTYYSKFRVQVGDKVEKNRFFIYRYPLEKTRMFMDATYHHVLDMAQWAKKQNIQFAVFILPRFQHWNSNECPKNWECDQYTRHERYQYEWFSYWTSRAAQVDFPIISLLEDFQATTQFPLCFDEDPHWNENGHAFMATTVFECLKRLNTSHTSSSITSLQSKKSTWLKAKNGDEKQRNN